MRGAGGTIALSQFKSRLGGGLRVTLLVVLIAGACSGDDVVPSSTTQQASNTTRPTTSPSTGPTTGVTTLTTTSTPRTTSTTSTTEPNALINHGHPEPIAAFYVAPEGSGSSCSHENPCSLSEARTRVRQLVPSQSGDIAVYLLGGTYRLDETFVLQASRDSGANGHFIRYEAAAGETPVISGGVPIDGWTLFDRARGIYRARLPAGLEFRQLWVNGTRADRTKSPLHQPGWVKTSTGFRSADESMSTWRNVGDLELVGLNAWKSFRCPISSISGAEINLAQPCLDLARSSTTKNLELPAWVENSFELLEVPGQWYHDRRGGQLYYIPRAGEDMATAEVIAPRVETLIRGDATVETPLRNLVVRGITFSHSTWRQPDTDIGYAGVQGGWYWEAQGRIARLPGGVQLAYLQDSRFEGNVFEHLGAGGLSLTSGSQRNHIEGNVFRDISGIAIQMGDVRERSERDPAEIATDNVIRNNYFVEIAEEFFGSVAIFAPFTDSLTVDHNTITDFGYTGVSVGWGGTLEDTPLENNRITNNRISYGLQWLQDGGLIYTMSKQPGTVISGNYLHSQFNLRSGLYLDNSTSGVEVVDNVIAGTPEWHYLQVDNDPKWARGNTLTSNYWQDGGLRTCGKVCADDWNTIVGNTNVPNGDWPPAADAIRHASGVQDDYLHILGGRVAIEAEHYASGGEGVGHHDVTRGNSGNSPYRALHRGDDGVDLFASWHYSNGSAVGDIDQGEWLAYRIDAPVAGAYDWTFVVGATRRGVTVSLSVDGTPMGSVAVPITAQDTTLARVALPGIPLDAGPHDVILTFSGPMTFDRFSLDLS